MALQARIAHLIQVSVMLLCSEYHLNTIPESIPNHNPSFRSYTRFLTLLSKYLDSDISETQTFQLWELIISVFKLSMFKLFLSFIAKLVIAHDSSL